MSDIRTMNESNQDLDWMAWRYFAGELSGAECEAFELRMETDQDACEALARAVELTGAIKAAYAESESGGSTAAAISTAAAKTSKPDGVLAGVPTTDPIASSRESRKSRSGRRTKNSPVMLVATSALVLVALLVFAIDGGKRFVGLSRDARLNSDDPAARRSMGDFGSESERDLADANRLIDLWVEARSQVRDASSAGDFDSAEWTPYAAGESGLNGSTAAVDDASVDDDNNVMPSWIMAAVLAAEGEEGMDVDGDPDWDLEEESTEL